MLNMRIVGRQSNGDFIVRPDSESREEMDLLIERRKTLLTAQQFNPNKITRPQQKNSSCVNQRYK